MRLINFVQLFTLICGLESKNKLVDNDWKTTQETEAPLYENKFTTYQSGDASNMHDAYGSGVRDIKIRLTNRKSSSQASSRDNFLSGALESKYKSVDFGWKTELETEEPLYENKITTYQSGDAAAESEIADGHAYYGNGARYIKMELAQRKSSPQARPSNDYKPAKRASNYDFGNKFYR